MTDNTRVPVLKLIKKMRSGATCGFKGICFGLLAACFIAQQVAAADDAAAAAQSVVAHLPKRANFERERASHEARHVADWVVDAGDNHAADNRSLPFVIVDKKDAKVFVFDAGGRLRGAAPALLGLARGDDSVPGIGEREMSSIRPEERTTPAGRFVAALDRDNVLWVDYETAISMHRVINTKPAERRLQRLASPTPLDNRISYGCINVPVKFYENVVLPAFAGTKAIVYVLPETRLAREVFASYDVEEHTRAQAVSRLDTERSLRPVMPIASAPTTLLK
jgi:hypothetical protein